MATFKPIAINQTGVSLPYVEGQFIVATQPFTDGSTNYPIGVYVDMMGTRKQLTMQGPKGETGDTGATGATGQNGQAATLTIGQVTTGAPGSPAQVSNSGTEQNAVINFVIPTGAAGPIGPQGAGWFHTTVQSSVTVQISSLQPQLAPQVGDGVLFSNGDVRQVLSVSGSTATLGDILFSIKGDPGIGNATLSNVDGDSTEDGFTQEATKGVAQAKNYYNEGTYDSSVSNGNGTGTVTRKTTTITETDIRKKWNRYDTSTVKNGCYQREFPAGTQFVSNINIPNVYDWNTNSTHYYDNGTNLLIFILAEDVGGVVLQLLSSDEYQYTEQVIENQPIDPANQEECLYWHDEWRKGLNLSAGQSVEANQWKTIGTFPQGTYTVSCLLTGEAYVIVQYTLDNIEYVSVVDLSNAVPYKSFYIPQLATIRIYSNVSNGNLKLMLNEGTHPYPYEDYHGRIVREKDLSGVQLFLEGVNPAQTIGGDWEDKGTVTTSDNTVFHAYRRLS